MSILIDLYHGRFDPNEDLEGWGFNGPVLGPFPFYHVTYNSTAHTGDNNMIIAGKEEEIPYWDKEDLIFLYGSYYGDMSIISHDDINISLDDNLSMIRERFFLTQEIFKVSIEDLPMLINHEETWVKQYATYRLREGI